MTTQFSKKTVNKGCYNNLDQFPETLDINGIIDLPIPISDKFWFVYKNSDFSFNEMQILNLNLAKLNIAHYKDMCGEKALAEIIKITELHEQFVIKLINGDAADRAAYIAAYRAAYNAAENNILKMLKDFFVNPIIIQI
jgi:hypothetical protein